MSHFIYRKRKVTQPDEVCGIGWIPCIRCGRLLISCAAVDSDIQLGLKGSQIDSNCLSNLLGAEETALSDKNENEYVEL